MMKNIRKSNMKFPLLLLACVTGLSLGLLTSHFYPAAGQAQFLLPALFPRDDPEPTFEREISRLERKQRDFSSPLTQAQLDAVKEQKALYDVAREMPLLPRLAVLAALCAIVGCMGMNAWRVARCFAAHAGRIGLSRIVRDAACSTVPLVSAINALGAIIGVIAGVCASAPERGEVWAAMAIADPYALGATSMHEAVTLVGVLTLTILLFGVVAALFTKNNEKSKERAVWKQPHGITLVIPLGLAFFLLAASDPSRDRKSTRLNSSHLKLSRMPSSA